MQPTVNLHYRIALPQEKAATYRVASFIIAGINLAAFVWFFIHENVQPLRIWMATGALLSMSALLVYGWRAKHKKYSGYPLQLSFVAGAICWFLYGNTWLGILLLLSAFFGWRSAVKPVLQLDKSGVRYPSFPAKTFTWDSVDFVLLRDGILSIELKDNHLYQFTLEDAVANEIDEAAFNSFCQQMKEA